MPDLGLISLFLALLMSAGNEGVVTLTKPAAPPAAGTRHYLVQVRILEVDEQGRTTLIASPSVQTTGAAAGVTIDGERGRRFEFHFSASVDGAPSPLPVVIGNDAVAPKPIAVAASAVMEADPALERKVSVRAIQQPRKDVIREVARQAGLNVAVAADSAADAVSQLAAPITIQIDNEPLDDVLKQLMEPLKLGYSVRHGLVLIGFDAPTPSAAPQRMSADAIPTADGWQVRVYDVAGLVNPDPTTDRPDFQPLLKRLQAEVLPKTWDSAGGEATVRGFDSTVSLVVRQTPAGHEAVAGFLARLRMQK
uniref:Uncharacterized protein n=1 Tax=Schlesneria paludicola TaxID=360056 RepID=A0A7C2JZB3_9PLAN